MLHPPWDRSSGPHAVTFLSFFFSFLDNITTLLAGSFKPPSWSCGKVTRVSFSSWADLLNFTCWTRLRKWDTGTCWINGDPILKSVVQSLEPNPHILVSGLIPSRQTWPSVLKGWGWGGFKKLIKKSQNAYSTSKAPRKIFWWVKCKWIRNIWITFPLDYTWVSELREESAQGEMHFGFYWTQNIWEITQDTRRTQNLPCCPIPCVKQIRF